jgi:hypothetical protein
MEAFFTICFLHRKNRPAAGRESRILLKRPAGKELKFVGEEGPRPNLEPAVCFYVVVKPRNNSTRPSAFSLQRASVFIGTEYKRQSPTIDGEHQGVNYALVS